MKEKRADPSTSVRKVLDQVGSAWDSFAAMVAAKPTTKHAAVASTSTIAQGGIPERVVIEEDDGLDDILSQLKEIHVDKADAQPVHGKVDLTLEELEEAIRATQATALTYEFHLDCARSFMKFQSYRQAHGLLDDVYGLKLTDENAKRALAIEYLALGQKYLSESKVQEAENCFRRAAQLQPNNAEIKSALVTEYLALGKQQLDNGHLDMARYFFEQAVSWQPQNIEVRIAVARVYFLAIETSGKSFHGAQRQYDEVIANLKEAIKIDQDHPVANFMLGKAYYNGQAKVKVVPYMEKAIAGDPGNIEAYLILAKIHYARGKEFYDREERDEGAAEYNKALESLLQVKSIDPTHVEALFILGNIYFTRKDLTFAHDCFREVLKLEPAHKDAALRVKDIAELRGNIAKVQSDLQGAWREYEAALATVQDAIRLNPLDDTITRAKQELQFRWGELGVEQVYEQLGNDVWATVATLGIADNLELSEAVFKDKGAEPFKQYGNKVNGRNKFGMTPLHTSISSLALVKRLVEVHKADINTPDSNGDTPIMVAAACGKTDVVSFLLEHGAELSCVNLQGNNIFHVVASNHSTQHNNTLDLREITILLVTHLRALDKTRQPTDIILSEIKGDATGTNLLLHLLTNRNKVKQNVRELAYAEKN